VDGVAVEERPLSILTEAAEAIDSHADYGAPLENHTRTAALWSAYLGITITARQVCMLNVLQKVSRDAHSAKRDNLVDIAGYARNAELCDHPQHVVMGENVAKLSADDRIADRITQVRAEMSGHVADAMVEGMRRGMLNGKTKPPEGQFECQWCHVWRPKETAVAFLCCCSTCARCDQEHRKETMRQFAEQDGS